MFDLDALFTERRRTYSRRLAVLTSTITDENEERTLEMIEEITQDRMEWLRVWGEVTDVVGTHDDAFALFVENFGMDMNTSDQLTETLRAFDSAYIGYMSAEDYAYSFTQDCHEVNDFIMMYVDFEKMGRDMELGGDITELDGHLFNCNW